MKLNMEFFNRDVLYVAPDLVGKILVREFVDGSKKSLRITETEAYRGEEDKACHASKGKTTRTEAMYMQPGTIYMYLIYGIHWMLNIVTEKEGAPQAILIRCLEGYNGPGKLTKAINVNKEFNKLNICDNNQLYIIDDDYKPELITKPRVGIDYAGEEWAKKEWRFIDNTHCIYKQT